MTLHVVLLMLSDASSLMHDFDTAFDSSHHSRLWLVVLSLEHIRLYFMRQWCGRHRARLNDRLGSLDLDIKTVLLGFVKLVSLMKNGLCDDRLWPVTSH